MTQRPRTQTAATPLWMGVAAAAAAVATTIWVVLTSRTGTTYHLFPFIVSASLGVMSRLGGPPLSRVEAAVTTMGGLGAVAAGWFVLVATDETSHATFVADQPGGVGGETIVIALLGAAFSVWWVLRKHGA
jgi:hypothetical protein